MSNPYKGGGETISNAELAQELVSFYEKHGYPAIKEDMTPENGFSRNERLYAKRLGNGSINYARLAVGIPAVIHVTRFADRSKQIYRYFYTKESFEKYKRSRVEASRLRFTVKPAQQNVEKRRRMFNKLRSKSDAVQQ